MRALSQTTQSCGRTHNRQHALVDAPSVPVLGTVLSREALAGARRCTACRACIRAQPGLRQRCLGGQRAP